MPLDHESLAIYSIDKDSQQANESRHSEIRVVLRKSFLVMSNIVPNIVFLVTVLVHYLIANSDNVIEHSTIDNEVEIQRFQSLLHIANKRSMRIVDRSYDYSHLTWSLRRYSERVKEGKEKGDGK